MRPAAAARPGIRGRAVPILLLLAAALAPALPAGCGRDAAPPPGGPAGAGSAPGPGGRRFLSIGTAPPGGAFFVVGAALSEVLASEGGPRWEVTGEATKGSQENIRRLDQGEMDFALSNAAITFFAVRGEEGWERPYPMRAVMTLAPNVALFIAPSASGVKRLADLKGRRVVVGPAGAGFEFFLRPLLLAHGLTFADFTPLYNTQTGAVDMLSDRSAAAAFLGGAIPTSSISQACASQDIVFVPYDEKAIADLSRRFLFFSPAVIPAGTYRGQEREFRGLDVGSMHLITSASADPDLVHQVTRTLWEHRDRVTEKHPAGRSINPKNVTRDTGTPFHPGAIRYYEEIGLWPRRDGAPAAGAEPGATPGAAGR